MTTHANTLPEHQFVDNIHVFPIEPVNTDVQEAKFIENNRYLKNEHQFNYFNIPGANFPGPSEVDRMRLTFESGLEDEINYYLNYLIGLSLSNPKLLSMKGEYGFLLDHLAELLGCFIINPNYTNKDINKSLDSSLILRNLVQDIENSQVVSMNSMIKESLLDILGNHIVLGDEISNEHYDASKELLRYSMDIVESISSYLAPAPADDPLFKALIKLLKIVNDRSSVITILRSLSRLIERQ
ncbi:unnamed protein product [Ambrosiozyma monospora]|uniref:Unnamed protein product n=1 Tax=Ambrosiozyma monospora TaxID=43982 RepID=A0A9W7DK66_AMBMO|nr:unnamed protein product [Ambrosiozyma monospora]